MRGKWLGWMLGAVVAAAIGLVLWMVYGRGPGPSAGGGRSRPMGDCTLSMPLEPRAMASWMIEPGSGTALYREAMEMYERKRGAFVGPPVGEMAAALDRLEAAARLSGPGVFADRMGEMITYEQDRPALAAVRGLNALALQRAAQHRAANEPARARKLYEALFTLGLKLYEERLVYAEWQMGRELMGCSRYFAEGAATAEEKQRWVEFDAQWARVYRQRIERLEVATVRTFAPNLGEMMDLAQHCPEITWRVEATLGLGRCRFTGKTVEAQAEARRALESLAKEPDERLRLAAQAALGLKAEELRMMR